MVDRLSESAQQEIRRIVSGMVSSRALQDDAGEELRGHLEDKALAYLNGEEVLSEADTLLLAREHLGNMVELSAKLAEVHRPLKGIFFTRELLAFFIVSLLVSEILATLKFPWYFIADGYIFLLGLTLVSLGVKFRILLTWRGTLTRGVSVWYEVHSRKKLWAFLALIFFSQFPLRWLWIIIGQRFPLYSDAPSAIYTQLLLPMMTIEAMLYVLLARISHSLC